MARFRPSAETWGVLKSMGSTYRFAHTSKGVRCEIVDVETSKGYAKNKDLLPTEKEALAAAIKEARVSDKPMTQAQIVADHKRLVAENKALKERLGDSDDSFDDDPYEGMKIKGLLAELKKKKLKVPAGKKTTKKWRNAVIDKLRKKG